MKPVLLRLLLTAGLFVQDTVKGHSIRALFVSHHYQLNSVFLRWYPYFSSSKVFGCSSKRGFCSPMLLRNVGRKMFLQSIGFTHGTASAYVQRHSSLCNRPFGSALCASSIPKLLFIAGTTAVGKSSLIQTLTSKLFVPYSLIAVDSAQLYKHMDIGSAKYLADGYHNDSPIGGNRSASFSSMYMCDVVEPSALHFNSFDFWNVVANTLLPKLLHTNGSFLPKSDLNSSAQCFAINKTVSFHRNNSPKGILNACFDRHIAFSPLATTPLTKNLPIFVGGSGYYFRALLHGSNKAHALPSLHPYVSVLVRRIFEIWRKAGGLGELYQKLIILDPFYADKIGRNDEKRILRALHINLVTGRNVDTFRFAGCGGSKPNIKTNGIDVNKFSNKDCFAEDFQKNIYNKSSIDGEVSPHMQKQAIARSMMAESLASAQLANAVTADSNIVYIGGQPYDCRCWFLVRSRESSRERIKERCEHILKMGLLGEVQRLIVLYDLLSNPSASKALGYRHCIQFLDAVGILKYLLGKRRYIEYSSGQTEPSKNFEKLDAVFFDKTATKDIMNHDAHFKREYEQLCKSLDYFYNATEKENFLASLRSLREKSNEMKGLASVFQGWFSPKSSLLPHLSSQSSQKQDTIKHLVLSTNSVNYGNASVTWFISLTQFVVLKFRRFTTNLLIQWLHFKFGLHRIIDLTPKKPPSLAKIQKKSLFSFFKLYCSFCSVFLWQCLSFSATCILRVTLSAVLPPIDEQFLLKHYEKFKQSYIRDTQQFAKRQETLFKREKLFKWIDMDKLSESEVADLIIKDLYNCDSSANY